jgi:hypothetical protein
MSGGSYAEAFRVTRFRKEAHGRGVAKLRDEANFLQGMPDVLRGFYPRLLHHGATEDHGYYLEEEFVELPNLREQLLSGSMTADLVLSVLRRLIEWACAEVYQPAKYPAPESHVEEFYFERAVARLRLSAAQSPVFDTVLKKKFITLNETRYVNVPVLLNAIRENKTLCEVLRVRFVAPFIHGDLHLQNVLASHNGERVILVDPRGYRHCDIYYDLGKLEHSLNGKYDLIHEGRYTVCGDRHELSDFRLSFTDLSTFKALSYISKRLSGIYASIETDQFAMHRVRFAEAVHFCADVPFHLKGDGKEDTAVAIYLTGLQLLNEFVDDFHHDLI